MPGGHLHSQGHSHSHSHRGGSQVEVGSLAKAALSIFLIISAVATLFGLIRYWPSDGSAVDRVASSEFAAPGVTFPIATVSEVLPPCAGADSQVLALAHAYERAAPWRDRRPPL